MLARFSSVSTFILLYIVLVKVCEEDPASHSYAVGKGKRILIAFSNNCGYSLIQQQNLTG